MAFTELYSGSASISTTEYSLTNNSTTVAAKTDDGVFQAFIDFNALAAGDLYVVKVYEKARSADTQRLASESWVSGPLAQPLWVAPSMVLLHGWDVTITKSAGTDRTITWSIRQVA